MTMQQQPETRRMSEAERRELRAAVSARRVRIEAIMRDDSLKARGLQSTMDALDRVLASVDDLRVVVRR